LTPEKKVQNSIINFLKKLKDDGKPIFYERRQAGGFSYKKGIPDLYCVYYGYHIEIEVKAENGELSVMQEKFRDMCAKNKIFWICSNSLEDFKIKFERIESIYIAYMERIKAL